MGSATVKWIGGLNFLGVDSNNHSVVLSGGKEAIGVSPSEMLLVALASCSSVDVVEILAKKRKPLSFLEVFVTSENDPDPPWTFRKIKVTYRLAGENLTEKAVSQAIALSQDKYCSVAATLRGKAEIVTDFEMVCEDEACIGKEGNPSAVPPGDSANPDKKIKKFSGSSISIRGKEVCSDEACIGKK